MMKRKKGRTGRKKNGNETGMFTEGEAKGWKEANNDRRRRSERKRHSERQM